ncbi:MAG: S-adenosyl-l-methionine hydroxide adenosyltransferase family protein [Vicinamibacterales bacterium]
MARPVIALLTDFGTRDHYVGVMKGVLLGICPDAALVDLTHEIPPQDVSAAAHELAASVRFFPSGTVFLVVIDPGVGTGRRALAARAGPYAFVGPDNGVLAGVLRSATSADVVALRNPAFARADISRTFEGRDRFAPAAGWLACGQPLDAFGPRIDDWCDLVLPAAERDPDGGVRGAVVRVDRFGNLVTNIGTADVPAACLAPGVACIRVAGQEIAGPVGTYAEAPEHGLCVLVGSTGQLEIAVRNGNAAERLGVGVGAPVVVRER